MGRTCTVPGCRTGYRTQPKLKGVSLHKFPHDPVRLQTWMKAFPTKISTVNRYSLICSLHFTPEDLIFESQDSNLCRKSRLNPLKRCYLSPTCVPSCFPILPSDVANQDEEVVKSEGVSHTDQQQIKLIKNTNNVATINPRIYKKKNDVPTANTEDEQLLEDDEINSIPELKQKLHHVGLPKGVHILEKDGKLLFYVLEMKHQKPPRFLTSLVINSSLQFDMWREDIPVPLKEVCHIVGENMLTRFSQVLNILTFLKKTKTTSAKKKLEMCASLLEDVIKSFDKIEN